MSGRESQGNPTEIPEAPRAPPPVTPREPSLILSSQSLLSSQSGRTEDYHPRSLTNTVPCSSTTTMAHDGPPPDIHGARSYINSFTFRPLQSMTLRSSHSPSGVPRMPSNVTITRRDHEQASTAYRYGLCSICLGVLCNWLGFFEASLNPIRYVGLGCVIIGSILIFMAVCQSLSVRQSARRRMCQQATQDLEAPSTYPVQTKPPEYSSLAFPNILPPSYEEAIANVYFPPQPAASSQCLAPRSGHPGSGDNNTGSTLPPLPTTDAAPTPADPQITDQGRQTVPSEVIPHPAVRP